MGKRLFYWELAGALFTAAMGTLLHFVYDWSGGWGAAAAFSAVNESTWEHMKLLFFPMFLFSVVQVCCLGRNYPNFLAARGVSTVTGVALIPVLFYTYTGVLGRHLLWADIAVLYLSVLGAFALDFRLLRRGRFTSLWQQILGLLALWGLAFLFVYCTFHPPEMKRLDENIADPGISADIVRLEQVSARIFDEVRTHPEKLPQIRRFLDYYLPTTLKLLNAYDRMSGTGVSGENIDTTLAKVEGMMRTIVAAFEKQLDSLYGAEALDISTDITVLENMMAREGLVDSPLKAEPDEKKETDIRLEL